MKSVIALILLVVCIATWLTSVIHDAMNAVYGWLVVDIFVSPLGVIRGALIWLGAV